MIESKTDPTAEEPDNWLDRTAIKINDTPITNEELLISTTVLIIIIVIITVICLGISWWKRKQIAEGMRRASTYVSRVSKRLRQSVREKMGAQGNQGNSGHDDEK